MNQARAKVIKIDLYVGNFKYKDPSVTRTRPSFRELKIVTSEKNTDNKQWANDIKKAVGFSLKTLRENLTFYARLPLYAFLFPRTWNMTYSDAPALPPVSLRRILSAYNDDRPFSVDLVGAVGSALRVPSNSPVGFTIFLNRFFDKTLLQKRCTSSDGANRDFSTTKKMKLRCTIVWPDIMRMCRSGKTTLTSLTPTLQIRFLDLMASTPTSFFVPTLDIDIAWQ